jgi:hypothetical protein
VWLIQRAVWPWRVEQSPRAIAPGAVVKSGLTIFHPLRIIKKSKWRSYVFLVMPVGARVVPVHTMACWRLEIDGRSRMRCLTHNNMITVTHLWEKTCSGSQVWKRCHLVVWPGVPLVCNTCQSGHKRVVGTRRTI